MAQTATQRITGSTRVRGPMIVALRGASSKGNENTYGGVAAKGVGLDVGFSVQIPAGQSANSIQIEQPDGTVIQAFDGSGNLSVLSGVSSLTAQQALVSLTAANLKAMYTTPVQIVAAPATGKAIVVEKIIFEITTTATGFANGGIVVFQYDTTAAGAGTLVHAGSIPASVITAGAGTTVTGLWAASGSNGLTIPTAKGIYISNQTAAFITGTGTAKVWISYGILTA